VSRVSQFKYASFKDLLASYTELLNIIADIEEKLRGKDIFGMSYIRSQSTRAVFHTLRMLKSFNDLSGQSYLTLFELKDQPGHPRGSEQEKELLVCEWCCLIPESPETWWIGSAEECESWRVGHRAGLAIPEGFAITTCAYDSFSSRTPLG
jgi:pyruvate,water dikinase